MTKTRPYPETARIQGIKVKDIHEHERPVERILSYGTKSMRDAELLAIILGTGSTEAGVLTFAEQLLTLSGGVRGILSADASTLRKFHGIGKTKAARILAVRGLLERFYTTALDRGQKFSDPNYTSKFFMAKLCDRKREIFSVVFLDNKHRMLGYTEMFQGTINAATVHPREVVRKGLELNAAAVIVAHNHPSGSPSPSDADRYTTKLLFKALKVSGIRLIDHVVVGETDTVSLAEEGFID